MADLDDIALSATINLLSALAFLIAFGILRLQPINDRVYFPKWYLKGLRASPSHAKRSVTKFVNLDIRMYLRFLKWMPEALRMPEPELIDHAGVDSVVYIRIYLLGLKIFVPIMVLAFAVLLPINWTGDMLNGVHGLTYSTIDKLSISNIPAGSNRFWAHLVVAYASTLWTCCMLYKEYKIVTTLRLEFFAVADRRPDQFSVLVRNVPPDPDESVSGHVEHFFRVNHPDHYLLHQVVYDANKLADLVDRKKSMKNWLIYYQNKYERKPSRKPTVKEIAEREKVVSDPEAILPAAFVSFRSRWGAAVCAQTQQSRNPTLWLTEWAPEPSDVYWNNLAIPYVEHNIRKLIMSVALFFLIIFFMAPITFVQSLANIDGIDKAFPFLKHWSDQKSYRSFVQGYLPGIILKTCLLFIPMIVMLMSKIEGFTSFSYLERRSAAKYYLFILVNVFLGNVVVGTAFQQLSTFLHKSPSEMPQIIGASIPMKATFFITFVMIDGWAGVALEIVRLVPLVLFHIKNAFLVKTEQDREEAMDPGFLDFPTYEPRIQLYFMLGLVYCVITPILLPFIIVFFAFAYLVFRHQIINVYDRKYESGAAFWPDVHQRILAGLVISHLLLLGLLSTKLNAQSVKIFIPLLVALPILTIWFHTVCKGRFESAFKKFPLQDAMMKDTLERATDPTLNIRSYLSDAYLHPIFKGGEAYVQPPSDEEEGLPLVATKRSQKSSKTLHCPPLMNVVDASAPSNGKLTIHSAKPVMGGTSVAEGMQENSVQCMESHAPSATLTLMYQECSKKDKGIHAQIALKRASLPDSGGHIITTNRFNVLNDQENHDEHKTEDPVSLSLGECDKGDKMEGAQIALKRVPTSVSKDLDSWDQPVRGSNSYKFFTKLKAAKNALKKMHILKIAFEEKELIGNYIKLRDIEKTIVQQKAKAFHISHNDSSSKYFYARIHERKNQQIISQIKDCQGNDRHGVDNVVVAFVEYCEGLLGHAAPITSLNTNLVQTGHCFPSEVNAKALIQTWIVQGRFSISAAYDWLRTSNPLLQWAKSLQHQSIIPSHGIIASLAVQKKLPTVDNVINRGLYIVNRCILCKVAAETYTHLFLRCPYVRII
ncbi:hypothetical protein KSS87_022204 [Heliosperma pusillum]|nr:hypothetical protein KSS87_022204 [Heliosperma pusillum]